MADQLAKSCEQEDYGKEERLEKVGTTVADHPPSEQTPATNHVERIAEGGDLMQTEEDGPLPGA